MAWLGGREWAWFALLYRFALLTEEIVFFFFYNLRHSTRHLEIQRDIDAGLQPMGGLCRVLCVRVRFGHASTRCLFRCKEAGYTYSKHAR